METILITALITFLVSYTAGYLIGYFKGKTTVSKADTMLNAYKQRTAAMLKIAGKK